MVGIAIQSIGPGCQVQDLGRPGWHRYGITQGGAMDRLAIHESATLLAQSADLACLEIAGLGGVFTAVGGPVQFSLTGAPMPARIDDSQLSWNASYTLYEGQKLTTGLVESGMYSYMGFGGGINTPSELGSRSTNARSALGGHHGRCLQAGDVLPVGEYSSNKSGLSIGPIERWQGGDIRVVWGPQAYLFSDGEQQRFLDTQYRVEHRLNRMGVRLQSTAAPLSASGHLSAVSDAVSLGDIQIPGDGYPAVLLADHQSTGGYPRIATIITADMARMAQSRPDTAVQFVAVDMDEAVSALRQQVDSISRLGDTLQPLLRHPQDIDDLLSYQLVSGFIADERLPWEKKNHD